MEPITFPQANCFYGPPPGIDDSQCGTIPAFRGNVVGGCTDGADIVIVAWLPSEEDRQAIAKGDLLYLGFWAGAIPPHFVTTEFPATKSR